MPKSIEQIDAEIEKLKAKRAQIAARETAEQRRKRTQQAIIVGTWVIANDQATVERVKASLTRPQDRRAFGLDVLPERSNVAA